MKNRNEAEPEGVPIALVNRGTERLIESLAKYLIDAF